MTFSVLLTIVAFDLVFYANFLEFILGWNEKTIDNVANKTIIWTFILSKYIIILYLDIWSDD